MHGMADRQTINNKNAVLAVITCSLLQSNHWIAETNMEENFPTEEHSRSHFCLPGWFQYPDNESSACVDQHLLHPTLFLSLCLYQMLTQSTHGLTDSNMHKVHFLHFFFGRGSGKLGGRQTWLIGPQICLSRQVRYSSRTDNINMWQSLFIEYFVKKKHFFKTTQVLRCLKNRFLQS